MLVSMVLVVGMGKVFFGKEGKVVLVLMVLVVVILGWWLSH